LNERKVVGREPVRARRRLRAEADIDQPIISAETVANDLKRTFSRRTRRPLSGCKQINGFMRD
jgi:hypothetical protein